MSKLIGSIIVIALVGGVGYWVYTTQMQTPAPQQMPAAADSGATNQNQPQAQTPRLPPGGMETGVIDDTATTSATTGKLDEFTVSGQNYSFTPSTLTVKRGDTVKINFKNSGGFHDLKIDEFAAGTPKISNGQEATIIFIADKTGAFEYYCSVGNLRAMGMKGTLTVE